MSTGNDASQTLFRMVSVRNPQLTETKEINFGFIQRPKGPLGAFDKALSDGKSQSSKLAKILETAPTVNTVGFRTENEIEAGPYGNLLIIGRKISKRQIIDDKDWKYTKNFYKVLVNPASRQLKKASINELTTLWDNLIYQMVTQKDFYVKEALSHILKALHLGFAQSIVIDEDIIKVNGENPLEKALDAKIVLPKELFMNNSSDSTGELVKTSTALSPITVQRLTNKAKKDIMVNEALYKKESLLTLNTELKQLEKSYYKQKNKVYNEGYSIYQKETQPKIDEFERKLNEIEGSVGEKNESSKSTLINEATKALEIPPFEFDYKSEINADDLKSNLSPESLHLFLNLFGKKIQNIDVNAKIAIDTSTSEKLLVAEQEIYQLDEYIETYNEAISEINNQISTQYEAVLQNTELVQQQYINIGGATIPIAQNTSKTHLAYLLAVQFAKINPTLFPDDSSMYVYFGFEVQDSSWNILYAKVIADTNNGYLEENYSNIAVINNTVTLPQILGDRFLTINSIRIEIYFGNGKEAFMELSPVPNGVKLTGVLTLKNVLPEATAKRKNFGIKRLGVADYLKVVQSVHAYVPGLVSNIENVMASELRHKSSVSRDYSEITDTTSKYQETEKISDTSKTSRTDMQSEVAREIDKQQSITGHTRFNYDTGVYKFEIGAEYANNTAQNDSTRQAVMKSQELTEKAMERVLTKISEERVQKIIKEYTETNVHEFDNRGNVTETNNPEAAQPKHITGVYRWIDIKYKNQIYNYGIRTMFEFMVPEPSRLHRLALAVSKGQILTAPTDPRKADAPWKMPDAKTATKELLERWAQIYNIKLEDSLPSTKQIIHQPISRPDTDGGFGPDFTRFDVPENYTGKNARFICRSSRNRGGGSQGSRYSEVLYPNFKGGKIGGNTRGDVNVDQYEANLNLSGNIEFFVHGHNVDNYNVQVTINCELSSQYIDKWKTENFNAIIKAYDTAYKTFQEEQVKLDEEQKIKEEKEKAKLGQFYRYMEQDVLKHNCIAYLLQDYLSIKSVGQNYTEGNVMENFAVNLGDDLDQYAALAKFIEQAFEWEIMDYTFYPYYWANRDKWQEMYISDSVDPLFRSFLQSGMARIIVTVRPGFENAVQFFLETGLIWNGGEVPVIGDPMYMSIVDEMRKTLGTPQGKYWITKLPTTLTILQDKSTGLPVDQPLPIFPESDPSNCENPSELVDQSSFVSRDISLGIELGEPSTLPKD
jgi:hypothetical protein